MSHTFKDCTFNGFKLSGTVEVEDFDDIWKIIERRRIEQADALNSLRSPALRTSLSNLPPEEMS